jgi:O-methyltransferase involved in polyketide biosynthesis
MEKSKVTLEKEMETLLIPLYGKAMESKRKSPILHDPKAVEIVERLHYDFNSLKIPEKTNTMMCLRAKLIDNFTLAYLENKRHTVVIHLGCGLDCRYTRINRSDVDWYEVDFKEVMEVRRRFFDESATYHLIGSSVTVPAWMEQIPVGAHQYLVIAEGLLMYLKADEIKDMLRLMKQRFGGYTLIFDAFSVFAAKQANHHPSIKKTDACIQWGLDSPMELTTWDTEINYVKEIPFTSNEVVEKMGFMTKLLFNLAHLFQMARKAQRLLVYTVGLP